MTIQRFFKRSLIAAPAEFVFAWHERPGAFFRLAPPWENIRLIRQQGGIRDGNELEFAMQLGPFSRRWIARHQNYIPGVQFEDVQIAGPFRSWKHTHRIIPDGPERCFLEDSVEYELPGGSIGAWLGSTSIHATLTKMFATRHDVTIHDIDMHWKFQKSGEHSPSLSGDVSNDSLPNSTRSIMRILLSGATGLIGSTLRPMLTTGGHTVIPLTRSRQTVHGDAVVWDPQNRSVDRSQLEGFDAVIHLAGENIGTKRWTPKQKEIIKNSRVVGTRFLCEQLAQLDRPPKVLVCASAIGYYGDRGDELLDEQNPPADDFLARVCREWETVTEPARQKNIRVINLRTGVVLSPRGGALHKMLTPFKLGFGGVVGSGRQYWSWVDIDDVAGVIVHCLHHEELSGPINGVAPGSVTNRDFTMILGKVLRRPTIFPLPAFVVKLMLGEMGEALLLSSTRVAPVRLEQSGYAFRYPTLEASLRHLLGR
ncbi:MAG: TIGR01777 family oxidoreductase [Planctomycetaceae bacterium]